MASTNGAAADVVIVGGGLSGCALAAALADGHRRIVVLEARTGKNPRFNGELIHPTGTEVLGQVGLLAPLEAAGAAILGFACVPGRERPATLLPYAEIPNSRPTGLALDHRLLVDALRAAVQKLPWVELRLGERVSAVQRAEERVQGVVSSSGPVTAKLVLGCDGRHSKLRTLLELSERARLLSFTAAVRLEDCRLPHLGFGHIFLGAAGPVLAYPIDAATARACLDLPADIDRGAAQVVARLRTDYLPQLPAAVSADLALALDGGELEIAANYSITTDECVVPGAALIGDAAGCSHPLTATGMTVAMNDVRLLAAALHGVDLAAPEQLDAACARYQQERYRFVRAREILADALYEVFRGADPGARAIRDGIFRYWSRSAGARTRSMALLSGAESRLPAFLREYLTVVGRSTASVLMGAVEDPTLGGKLRSLIGLGKKSVEKLGLVARGVREGALR